MTNMCKSEKDYTKNSWTKLEQVSLKYNDILKEYRNANAEYEKAKTEYERAYIELNITALYLLQNR